ncbi:MAG TPA: ROK family protein [Thermomicrobiales bacterium]|nr:ROK family protein [Thermomicrobiales bacterium]
MPMAVGERAVAVDLGGTNLRVALVRWDGVIEARRSERTPPGGPGGVIERMVALIGETAAEAGDERLPVGVAVPGPLDPAPGIVAYTPNLPGWRRFPLGATLRSHLGRSTRLVNDGNSAAVGEARFGAAKGCDDLVYLALGTGVGGGIISAGRLLEGATGLAGEVGHVTVALDGGRCTCGSVGCLETFAAGWAIKRDAELVAATAEGRRLRELAGDGPVTPPMVAAAAVEGDPAGVRLLQRAGRALGAAMGVFVNLFNPKLIVVGGGIATLGDPLLGPAEAAIADHCFPLGREEVRIERSTLGDDTALLGAAALALDA